MPSTDMYPKERRLPPAFQKKEKETAGRQAPIDIIHGLCPGNEPAEKPEPGAQPVGMIYFLTNFLTSDDVPWSIIRI